MDLDGTLEDSRHDMAAAVQRVRAAFGLDPGDAAEHRQQVNRGMDALYRACFRDLLAGITGRPEALEPVRRAYEADYLAHVAEHTRPYPGIPEALRELSRLGRIVVITNKPEKISRALLEALGLSRWIADVIGGDTCAEGKPSPAPLHLALARQRLRAPVPAVMIGDTVADLRAGRAFGARTLFCAWGYSASPEPEVPDASCREPGDLPAAAQRLLGAP